MSFGQGARQKSWLARVYTSHPNSFLVELCATETCYSANGSIFSTKFRHMNFEVIHCENFKMIEATWSKSENLVKQKKIYFTNFSKLEYLLSWLMVNFCLRVALIWDLSSEIQGFEALAWARSKASNPWILDDKSQIWGTFRQNLTIGHKSKYPYYEKLIEYNFFCLTKFSLFSPSSLLLHQLFWNLPSGSFQNLCV